ncbi:MAG: hypothetical protein ACRDTG_26000, partial [Pseudonocardiaceae bacterium]
QPVIIGVLKHPRIDQLSQLLAGQMIPTGIRRLDILPRPPQQVSGGGRGGERLQEVSVGFGEAAQVARAMENVAGAQGGGPVQGLGAEGDGFTGSPVTMIRRASWS